VPAPALVIIETIDSDIRCDGTDDKHVPEFGSEVGDALKVITDASPNSKILMVTQRGRPAAEAAVIVTNPEARAAFAGTGMCDGISPASELVESNLAMLTAIIESYESEQERVCATVPQCSTDGGALTRYESVISDLVPADWNHLNVRGLEHVAEIEWPVVAALLQVAE
jgi:hypothetical protein